MSGGRPTIDETGKRYGCLSVIRRDERPTPPDGRNRAYWVCRCACGREKSILGDHLRTGAITTCSECGTNPVIHTGRRGQPVKNEVGIRYGYLTVIERQKQIEPGRSRWICMCDCGNETVVSQGNLRAGHAMTCGCKMYSKKWREAHVESIPQSQ